MLDQFLARHEFGVAAEQNVGSAAGHVGGDGDHAEAAGLGDDFGFLLVELGVEDDVANAFALRISERRSDFSMEMVPTRTGCLALVELRDVVGDGVEFFLFGAEDDVGVLDAQQRRLVGMTTISSL